MRRLTNEARALRDGSRLHLWWHPHNLTPATLGRLDQLLDGVLASCPPGTRTTTMGEIGDRVG